MKTRRMGKIEVVAGGMFSGKTSEWFRRLEREELANRKVGYFKPENENRYGVHTIRDRNNKKEVVAYKLPINATPEQVPKLVEIAALFDVVGIDEVQFFGDWIVDFCLQLQARNIRVIVNGLDTTYEGRPFGPMGLLMTVAFSVDKLHAVCMCCGEDANYSQRLYNGKPATSGEVFCLGDKEEDLNKFSYEARCQNCFVPPNEVK